MRDSRIHSLDLDSLQDVSITPPVADNNILQYNAAIGQWENRADLTLDGNATIQGLDSLFDISGITVTPTIQNTIKFTDCTMDVVELAAFQPLYSGFVKQQGSTGFLVLCGVNDGSSILRGGVNADDYARLKITADGKIEWGTGSLVPPVTGDPRTVNLYYGGQDILQTDDNLVVGLKLTAGEAQIDNININGSTISSNNVMAINSLGAMTVTPSGDFTVNVGSNSINLTAGTATNIGGVTNFSKFEADGSRKYVGSARALNLVWDTETFTSDDTLDTENVAVLLDGSSNTVTATLPTAVGIQGRVYYIKSIDATFTTDVATNGSETIDDDASWTLASGESITIVSDNANWWII